MSNGAFTNPALGIQLSLSGAQQVSQGFNSVASAATGMGNAMDRTNFSAMRYGFDQIARVGQPVFAMFQKGIAITEELEQKFHSLRKAMSPEEFQTYGRGVEDYSKKLGTEFGIGAAKATDAITAFWKAGVNPTESQAVDKLDDFNKKIKAGLSYIFMSDEMANPKKAAEQLVVFTNVLQTKLEDIGPKIFALGNAIPGGPAELSRAFSYALPALDKMGGSIEDRSKQLAGLVGNMMFFTGGTGSRAGTTIMALFDAISKKDWKGNDPFKELAVLLKKNEYVEVIDKKTNKMRSLESIVGDTAKELAELEKRDPNAAIGWKARLAGTQGGRAFDYLLTQYRNDFFARTHALEQVFGSATATTMERALKDRLKDPTVVIGGMRSAFKNAGHSVGITVYESLDLGSVFSKIARTVTGAATAYEQLFRSGKDVSQVLKDTDATSVSLAVNMNSFVMALAGSFRALIEPVTTFFGLFSSDSGWFGSFAGRIVGISAAITGMGLVLGIAGLAWTALKSAVHLVAIRLPTIALGLSGTAAAGAMATGPISLLKQTMMGLQVVLVDMYIWFERMNAAVNKAGLSMERDAARKALFARELAATTAAGGMSPLQGGGLIGYGKEAWQAGKTQISSSFWQGATGAALMGTGAIRGGASLLGSGLWGMAKGVAGLAIPFAGLALTVLSVIDIVKSLFGATDEQRAQALRLSDTIKEENALRRQQEIFKNLPTGTKMGLSPEYIAGFMPAIMSMATSADISPQARSHGSWITRIMNSLGGEDKDGAGSSFLQNMQKQFSPMKDAKGNPLFDMMFNDPQLQQGYEAKWRSAVAQKGAQLSPQEGQAIKAQVYGPQIFGFLAHAAGTAGDAIKTYIETNTANGKTLDSKTVETDLLNVAKEAFSRFNTILTDPSKENQELMRAVLEYLKTLASQAARPFLTLRTNLNNAGVAASATAGVHEISARADGGQNPTATVSSRLTPRLGIG